MEKRLPTTWPTTVARARAVQEALRGAVIPRDRIGGVRLVAGVDAGYDRRAGRTHAAAALLDAEDLTLVERVRVTRKTRFPYVPGYLSFREAPAVLAALEKLKLRPDLIVCDGHGLAHPRRFGLACHIGVLLDTPSIGVAKSRLIGTHAEPPSPKGGWTPLIDGREQIGAVLRTRVGVKPVYVSTGHRVGLETAVRHVLGLTSRYRLPEPIRWAHRIASGTGAEIGTSVHDSA